MTPTPYRIHVPDETLDHIMDRVRAYRWHEMPDDGGWAYGTNMDWLREICSYWANGYDWRAAEAELNRLPHLMAEVDGQPIHYIHEKGSGPAPMPLIITHGWPGSVAEFTDVIGPLAHPERYGGNSETPLTSLRRRCRGSGSRASRPVPSGRVGSPGCLPG